MLEPYRVVVKQSENDPRCFDATITMQLDTLGLIGKAGQILGFDSWLFPSLGCKRSKWYAIR